MAKPLIGKHGKLCLTIDFNAFHYFRRQEYTGFGFIHYLLKALAVAPIDPAALEDAKRLTYTSNKFCQLPTERRQLDDFLNRRTGDYLKDFIRDAYHRTQIARTIVLHRQNPNMWIKKSIQLKPFLHELRREESPWKETVVFITLPDECLHSSFRKGYFFKRLGLQVGRDNKDPSLPHQYLDAVIPSGTSDVPRVKILGIRDTLRAIRPDHEEFDHLYFTTSVESISRMIQEKDSSINLLWLDRNPRKTPVTNGITDVSVRISKENYARHATISGLQVIDTLGDFKKWRPIATPPQIKFESGHPPLGARYERSLEREDLLMKKANDENRVVAQADGKVESADSVSSDVRPQTSVTDGASEQQDVPHTTKKNTTEKNSETIVDDMDGPATTEKDSETIVNDMDGLATTEKASETIVNDVDGSATAENDAQTHVGESTENSKDRPQ